MSDRALKTLVGALVVAIGIWLLSSFPSGDAGSITASGPISNIFDDVNATSVESIEMVRWGQPIWLQRSGDAWTANGFPADPEAISRLLDELPTLRIGELTATNPQNHARMGVATDSAIAVTFEVEGSERTLLVGAGGRRFGTAYVRLPDDDEVYLLEGDLRGQITRDLDGWRDRTVVAVDTAALVRIEIARPEETYTLVRADSAWTLDGEAASGPAVSGLLSELSRLVASGFLTEADSIASLEQASTTRAWNEAGTLLAVITIGAGDGDRWARTSSNEYVYRVSSFRAGRIAPKREDVATGS